MIKPTTHRLIAAALTALMLPAMQAQPEAQDQPAPAIDNAPAGNDEPTLDDLLGLDDDNADQPDASADPAAEPDVQPDADAAGPELTRDLDRRLSGQEASEQFAQAIQEMAEVAIRLGDEADPGIDTQRMQDEIILKLEQIVASAEKKPSSQKPPKGQPQPGQPRQADRGGQQPDQPGEQQGQPGQQPGEQQAQGDQPGNQPGQQPGQQDGEGQGQQPGEQNGDQQAQANQPGDQQGQSGDGENARQGSVRNAELSMKDLREGEWGNLPPRLRDELAESLSESFNPVYRAATEAFYRRIAEMSGQAAEESE